MLGPVIDQIEPQNVELFNRLTYQNVDARTVMGLLGNPDWHQCASLEWKVWIPSHLQEQWRSLSWETRVVAYTIAEDSSRIACGDPTFKQERG